MTSTKFSFNLHEFLTKQKFGTYDTKDAVVAGDKSKEEQVRGFQCHHFNLESCSPSHNVPYPLLAECDQ
ncbi:hypothetical protein SO802_013139 [Lithocarpus litseifolius]|uniref:Uncharacterized protein n=1 Tax=Lithocarpus litseifolius TaxID=425828 RepID=A0AAW2D7E2_9ROSI